MRFVPQVAASVLFSAILPAMAAAQESLPFPPAPSASVAGRTIAESIYRQRVEPRRLPADVPNVLIVLIDDVGPGPLDVMLKVNGAVVASDRVNVSAPLLFTDNDCLDIGTDLGSPVSLDYFDQAPFRFDGTLRQVHVKYVDGP